MKYKDIDFSFEEKKSISENPFLRSLILEFIFKVRNQILPDYKLIENINKILSDRLEPFQTNFRLVLHLSIKKK